VVLVHKRGDGKKKHYKELNLQKKDGGGLPKGGTESSKGTREERPEGTSGKNKNHQKKKTIGYGQRKTLPCTKKRVRAFYRRTRERRKGREARGPKS